MFLLLLEARVSWFPAFDQSCLEPQWQCCSDVDGDDSSEGGEDDDECGFDGGGDDDHGDDDSRTHGLDALYDQC